MKYKVCSIIVIVALLFTGLHLSNYKVLAQEERTEQTADNEQTDAGSNEEQTDEGQTNEKQTDEEQTNEEQVNEEQTNEEQTGVEQTDTNPDVPDNSLSDLLTGIDKDTTAPDMADEEYDVTLNGRDEEEDYSISPLDSSIINGIDGNTQIDNQYGFSLKNECSSATISPYLDHVWNSPAGQELTHGGTLYWTTINNALDQGKKGKVWIQWNNVGSFEGKQINLKCTLMDWAAAPSSADGSTWANVSMSKEYVGWIQVGWVKDAKFKFEFLDNNGNPLHIKGHATLFDLDNNQGFYAGTNIKKVYYNRADNWFYANEYGESLTADSRNSSNSDMYAWSTILFDGTYFELTFIQEKARSASEYLSYPGQNNGGGGNSLFGVIPQSIAKFTTPVIRKYVDKTELYNGNLTYNIYTTIPNEIDAWKYSNLSFTDQIDKKMSIKSIKIFDTTYGSDYTNKFTISTTDNRITAVAKNPAEAALYGRELRMTVTAAPNKASNWSGLSIDQGGKPVNNQAVLSCDRGTSNSNTVKTIVKAKSRIKVVNGTIDAAEGKGIAKNETKDGFTFYSSAYKENVTYRTSPKTGYMLKSITVNGVSQPVTVTKASSSYTFKEMTGTENEIIVEYQPCFKITTSVVNGTITDGIDLIKSGESKTIQFHANSENYYLKSITVDGVSIDMKEYMKNHPVYQYDFKAINANHDIKVVFAKRPVLTITKQIHFDEVVWEKGTPTFLYQITGTDYLGKKQTYYREIHFTKKDSQNKSIQMNITAGTYTVSELKVNGWKLSKIEAGENASVNGQNAVLNTLNADTASCTFLNTVSDYRYFSANDILTNDTSVEALSK